LESKKGKIEFLSIGDVSQKTGVKPYILRYWEKEFPFLQPLKNKAGHRIYSPRDLFIIKNIKKLLYAKGYSISGAKKVLWEILLGNKNTGYWKQIEEIRKDLLEALEIINKSLDDHTTA
jgi:DNA-binding transcriptional MerR regulator